MGLMNGFVDKDNPVLKMPGGHGIITAAEWAINASRANSLWTVTFGLACCAIEMMSTAPAKYDWARFGFEVPAGSPRRVRSTALPASTKARQSAAPRNRRLLMLLLMDT